MPGTKLSQLESHLARQWDNGKYPYETLRAIRVDGAEEGDGLRGIKSLELRFDYPITVVSGRNGSGKSTLLALSCLGFHGVEHYIPPGRAQHYYTFKDFFFRGPQDPDVAGVTIRWEYAGGREPLTIRKQSNKWMRYERRPQRPVLHIGASRILPAIDQPVLRTHFRGSERKRRVRQPLSQRALDLVGFVMGRAYTSAETLTQARYSLRSCSSDAQYSSFNMGSGEDVVIELMAALDQAPSGSLVTIEEIELGIHPHALKQLAEALQRLAKERSLQIICTSHSDWFIDALPRRARVLIERLGNDHLVTAAPTTRYAISQMAGRSSEELVIYCEDEVAARLIQRSLTDVQRRRTKIVPVGDKSQLLPAANFHRIAQHGSHHLVIWDGDVADGEIRKWHSRLGLSSEATGALSWTRLAGSGTAPERHIFQVVSSSDAAVTAVASQLGVEGARVREVLVQSQAQLDHHDGFHEAAQQLGYGGTRDTVLEALVSAYVNCTASEADNIRSVVDLAFDSKTSRDPDPLSDPADLGSQDPVTPRAQKW